MNLKKSLLGLAVGALVTGSVLSRAEAGEGCCAWKGAKAKGKSACLMSAAELKNCPMSEKRMSKTDKVMYVCPEMDFCGEKSGICPTDGKKLKKMYCPVQEAEGKRVKDSARKI